MLDCLKAYFARLTGYFWVPCPNCGEMFGGWEIGESRISTGPHTALLCCRRCD